MNHVFPKWFYHNEYFPEGKIIRTKDEFDKMPKGFVESPANFDKVNLLIVTPNNEAQELNIEVQKEEIKPSKKKKV